MLYKIGIFQLFNFWRIETSHIKIADFITEILRDGYQRLVWVVQLKIDIYQSHSNVEFLVELIGRNFI